MFVCPPRRSLSLPSLQPRYYLSFGSVLIFTSCSAYPKYITHPTKNLKLSTHLNWMA